MVLTSLIFVVYMTDFNNTIEVINCAMTYLVIGNQDQIHVFVLILKVIDVLIFISTIFCNLLILTVLEIRLNI